MELKSRPLDFVVLKLLKLVSRLGQRSSQAHSLHRHRASSPTDRTGRTVVENRKKSHSTLCAKRATFTILSGQKLIKNAKTVNFGEFLKS